MICANGASAFRYGQVGFSFRTTRPRFTYESMDETDILKTRNAKGGEGQKPVFTWPRLGHPHLRETAALSLNYIVNWGSQTAEILCYIRGKGRSSTQTENTPSTKNIRTHIRVTLRRRVLLGRSKNTTWINIRRFRVAQIPRGGKGVQKVTSRSQKKTQLEGHRAGRPRAKNRC